MCVHARTVAEVVEVCSWLLPHVQPGVHIWAVIPAHRVVLNIRVDPFLQGHVFVYTCGTS